MVMVSKYVDRWTHSSVFSCSFFNDRLNLLCTGPTEATVLATNLECMPNLEFMTIGSPEFNMHAYVVDSSLRAVPMGVPGELLLSGPRLALGYAGRPDLTAEAFVPNPCSELIVDKVHPTLVQYYKKAYRTGDLVRWRADGSLDYMGRIDRQVKITGVRIELGEVEAALQGGKGVSQAVATAVPDLQGQKRLVGYVTPGDVNPGDVLTHCRSVLVPAMVPSVIVALDMFPLLPNGKVDVKSLPAPDWSLPVGLKGFDVENEGPLDSNSAAVVDIIRSVLGLDEPSPVPMKAELFDLGASSIQIAVIVGRIRKELEVNIDMRLVYQNPLVEFLCTIVRDQKSSPEGKCNV